MPLLARIRPWAWNKVVHAQGWRTKWKKFFRTAGNLTVGEFVIYNGQAWQFGWDYEVRRDYYIEALKPLNVVCLDLESRAMTLIARWRLGSPAKESVTSEMLGVVRRMEIDHQFRRRRGFPISSKDYKRIVGRSGRVRLWPQGRKSALGIVKHPRCRGLVISQESGGDWPWALEFARLGKSVFEPEGPLGSTRRTSFRLDDDVSYIRQVASEASGSPERRTAAVESLESRTRGDYARTPLANYMLLKPKGSSEDGSLVTTGKTPIGPEVSSGITGHLTVVFFLHALGDTANAQMYDYGEVSDLDYFDQTLRVLEVFDASRMPLRIKPHPLAFMYRGEAAALAAIDRVVSLSEYLSWVDDSLSVATLAASAGNAVAISGRGSVLAEAAYAGLPAVSLLDCHYSRLGVSTWVEDVVRLPGECQLMAENWNSERAQRAREAAIEYELFLHARDDTQFYRLRDYNRQSRRNEHVRNFTLVGTPLNLGPLANQASS